MKKNLFHKKGYVLAPMKNDHFTWIRKASEGIEIFLHCQPGAKKTEVQGIHGERLKIRLAAPAVEGKANEALIAWLAKELGIPKLNIQLINGDTGRQKRLLITGVKLEKIQSLYLFEDESMIKVKI